MLCSNCGKREVEVLIKQVTNQETSDLNLCRICAEEMGFLSPDIPSITISFSVRRSENIGQDTKTEQIPENEEGYDSLLCNTCGTEYRHFRKSGLLGCAACYEAFRFPLGAYLQRIQGAESHWSGSHVFESIETLERGENTPASAFGFSHEDKISEILRLRQQIFEAVRIEAYEQAAELKKTLTRLLTSDGEDKDDS